MATVWRWIRRLWLVLVGGLALVGLLVVGGVFAAFWFLDSRLSEFAAGLEIPERAVLSINLDDDFPERQPALQFPPGDSDPTLARAVAGIRAAAADPRIVALFADLNGMSVDLARAQALRRAVEEFRASGKPAYVYSESLGFGYSGTLETWLASAFEEVWLLPSGEVWFNGIGLEQPFLAPLLDEQDVQARFEQREEYKGGADMFLRDGFHPAVRENLAELIDDLESQLVTGVAEGRGLETETVRALMRRAILSASEAVDARLADRLYYEDEVQARIDTDFGEPEWLDLAAYLDVEDPFEPADGPGEPVRIAIVTGDGAIFPDGSDGDDPFAEEGFLPYAVAGALAEAAEDPDVRAIVLRINSPGGDYLSSDVVRRAVIAAKASGKPVIASLGDVAASGGYFAAMAADVIVAEPGSVVGSIGVYSGKFVVDDLLQRLGIRFDRILGSEKALMFSPMRDFTPEEAALFSASIDRVYADFRSKALADRGLDAPGAMDRVDGGRVFTGRDGLALGLVDQLGGEEVALAVALERLGLPAGTPVERLDLPQSEDWWSALGDLGAMAQARSGSAGGGTPALGALAALAREIGLPSHWLRAEVLGARPVALLPPVTLRH